MASFTKGFVKPPLGPGDHVYEGMTFPATYPAANLEAMKTWQVRPDDIFCVTFPKSGKPKAFIFTDKKYFRGRMVSRWRG